MAPAAKQTGPTTRSLTARATSGPSSQRLEDVPPAPPSSVPSVSNPPRAESEDSRNNPDQDPPPSDPSDDGDEGTPSRAPTPVGPPKIPHPTTDQLLATLVQIMTSRGSDEGRSTFKTPSMKAPDSFDGSSPSKLRGFIQSCNLIFNNDPRSFPTDRRKVIYASGYLTGKCARWIEPYLSQLGNEEETFLLNSWETFEGQLSALFGDRNEVRNAELALDALTMKDNGHASVYITDFRTLCTRITGWGDKALMFHFRKGLPTRLLDLLATHHSKIDSLAELINITLEFDIRHHEHQREKKRENPISSTKDNSTERKADKEKAKPKPHQDSSKKKTAPSTPYVPKSELPLDATGKLKDGERTRREKAGLCLYCGGKHSLENCEKRKKSSSTVPPASNPSGKV